MRVRVGVRVGVRLLKVLMVYDRNHVIYDRNHDLNAVFIIL
jgi:hypothetical protein